ncbi:hypothetical protein D2V93_10820 [Flagellimonas taeanensis]|uniref:hypothetical protein n=1 Tax=Flavobacteriaceae TaxID=49546 RepID=UPI000E6802F3|nr:MULTISPECIES: hypothetical protein [Allomuricauda]MDC6386028.1 hypothetical protein [Muricauda sp. SK9]RIV50271.1 hypothetical protein D2V93_10820 [Allomuricauda taeanensis]
MNCNFDRHCTKVPIPNECIEYCTEKILRLATPDEKQLIIGLDIDLAQKIFMIYNTYSVQSFEDLQRNLSKTEINVLKKAFFDLTQSRLSFFQKSKWERDYIINQIKRGNLNADNLDDLSTDNG